MAGGPWLPRRRAPVAGSGQSGSVAETDSRAGTATDTAAPGSPPAARSLTAAVERPTVSGKFLTVGGRKLLVRGVTYGTFRPDADGDAYPDRAAVARDFAAMAANGVNSVRTYTVPPRWLLDLARAHGLFVMVGMAWEQHVAFLDHRGRPDDIEQRIRAGVRACAGHAAVLCYCIGNEIPASIVRWHGRR